VSQHRVGLRGWRWLPVALLLLALALALAATATASANPGPIPSGAGSGDAATYLAQETPAPTVGVIPLANPSADIDQCANDPAPSPSSDGCNGNASQWVNGNLGACWWE
jgi:hypothetical protein